MKYSEDRHHRQSIRLKGYDYSQNGAYFVTICTKERVCFFGNIVNNDIGNTLCIPTEMGKIAQECWYDIPNHYPSVLLDAFILMPNHIHGILFLGQKGEIGGHDRNGGVQNRNEGVQDIEPLRVNKFQKIIPGSIGAIIRGYKIGVTKWARNHPVGAQYFVPPLQKVPPLQIWQRNYYEHIIRDEKSCNNIRKYIANNPMNWKKDELYAL
jgi:REP element-mobilizing transposase RayT